MMDISGILFHFCQLWAVKKDQKIGIGLYNLLALRRLHTWPRIVLILKQTLAYCTMRACNFFIIIDAWWANGDSYQPRLNEVVNRQQLNDFFFMVMVSKGHEFKVNSLQFFALWGYFGRQILQPFHVSIVSDGRLCADYDANFSWNP